MIFLTQLEDLLFWASLYTEVLSLKGIFVPYFYYQIFNITVFNFSFNHYCCIRELYI